MVSLKMCAVERAEWNHPPRPKGIGPDEAKKWLSVHVMLETVENRRRQARGAYVDLLE